MTPKDSFKAALLRAQKASAAKKTSEVQTKQAKTDGSGPQKILEHIQDAEAESFSLIIKTLRDEIKTQNRLITDLQNEVDSQKRLVSAILNSKDKELPAAPKRNLPEFSEVLDFCEAHMKKDADCFSFLAHAAPKEIQLRLFKKYRSGGGWIGPAKATLTVIRKMFTGDEKHA